MTIPIVLLRFVLINFFWVYYSIFYTGGLSQMIEIFLVLCIEIGRFWCHNDVIKLCKFIILHILKNYSMSNFAKIFIYDPFTKIMLTIMIFLYLLLPSVIQRHIYMFMFVFYQFSINQNFLHNKFMLKMKKILFCYILTAKTFYLVSCNLIFCWDKIYNSIVHFIWASKILISMKRN